MSFSFDDGSSNLTASMDLDFVEHEWKQEFHGTHYIILITRNGPQLNIEAEQLDTNERWSGEFSSNYVEEITHKAGSFKRFTTFVRMLCSAFNRDSKSVFVELLTYADLELMKARKMASGGTGAGGDGNTSTASVDGTAVTASSTTGRNAHKRYIILTYNGEFDRVHYPLPLNFEETPNAESLQRTIRRLRGQIAQDATNSSREDGGMTDGMGIEITVADSPLAQARSIIGALRKENTELRHRLRQCEARLTKATSKTDRKDVFHTDPSPRHGTKAGSTAEYMNDYARLLKQYDCVKKDLADTSLAYDRLRVQSSKEINRWKSITGMSQRAESNTQNSAAALHSGFGSGSNVSELRRRLASLEKELENERTAHKKTVTLHRREVSEMLKGKTPKYSRMNDKWRNSNVSSSGYGGSTQRSSSAPKSRARATGYRSDSSNEGRTGRVGRVSVTSATASSDARTSRRSSRPLHSSVSPSRPSSASNTKGHRSSSLGGRFDPTAYAKEKERRQQLARSRERPGWGSGTLTSPYGSPARGRDSTDRSVGGGSRYSHRGRQSADGGYSSADSAASRRSRTRKSSNPTAHSTRSSRSKQATTTSAARMRQGRGKASPKQKSADTTSGAMTYKVLNASPSASRQSPPRNASVSANGGSSPPPAFPDVSGGVGGGGGIFSPNTAVAVNTLSSLKNTEMTSPSAVEGEVEGDSAVNAKSEITEIDKRIVALQSFLDNARDKFSQS